MNELFVKFEAAGDRAIKTKRRLVEKMITGLSVHAAIEEQAFYPVVREGSPELNDEVLEGIEEHHVVKWTLSELDGMSGDEDNFDAKVTVLIESVRHHVKEEEKVIFPAVRKAFGRPQLEDLGEVLAKAQKTAPVHPHPRSPSTPPANVVVGAVAGIVDKARDAGKAALSR